ncbi:unnamed protein product [Closterium sp. NIES-54]
MRKCGQVAARLSIRAVGHSLTRRSELVSPGILKISTTHQVRGERGEVETRQGAGRGRRTREDSGVASKDRTPRGVCQGDRNRPTERRKGGAVDEVHEHSDDEIHDHSDERDHGTAEGLTRALLLLGSPLLSSASAGSTSAAAASASATPPATATAASSSTAATEAPTSATTPTPTPSSSPTATTAAPTTSSSSLAPLGLADAASLTRSRRSADRLSANEVDSSSRGNRGQKRNRGAPLKERGTGVTTRGAYSCNTSLGCKEALLEEVDSEGGRAKREEVVPDRAKSVRESSD